MRLFGLLFSLALLVLGSPLGAAQASNETRFVFEVGSGKQSAEQVVDRALRIVEQRIAAMDSPRLSAKHGEFNRIVVSAYDFPTGLRDELIYYLTVPGRLTFNLVDTNEAPENYRPGLVKNGRVALPDDSLGGQLQVIRITPLLTGADLKDAKQAFDSFGNPSIDFLLAKVGAEGLRDVTTANVGKSFAIVMDNRIVTAPRIVGPIEDGHGQITGRFTIAEAKKMAALLRAGELPAQVRLIEVIEGK